MGSSTKSLILWVDDEQAVLRFMKRVLSESGHEVLTFELKGLELGAADYLKKPIKKDILLMRVQKVLKRPVSRTK